MSKESHFAARRKYLRRRRSKPEGWRGLFKQIEEINCLERLDAQARQEEAGIEPFANWFQVGRDPELGAALAKLWVAGNVGKRDADHVLRLLYSQAQRGLLCLSRENFVEFTKLQFETMRGIAQWLVRGETLARARWLVGQETGGERWI
jgi:hypothetical protein